MKKFCIIFLLSIIISLTGFGLVGEGGENGISGNHGRDYLRIHIRANSNESKDQAVKYLVKDGIVDFLTPVISEADTFEKAERTVKEFLGGIEGVAERVLKEKGFSYGANAEVRTETFPTRSYGEYVLEKGEYLALIVELGEGKGNNWWCVLYPPLCFVGESSSKPVYKSKLLEIIERWKNA